MFEAHWYEWLAAIICTLILFGDSVFGEGGRAKAEAWAGGSIFVTLIVGAFYLIATLPQ
jgi:hypothetical protein